MLKKTRAGFGKILIYFNTLSSYIETGGIMANSALTFVIGFILGIVFIYLIVQLGYVNLSNINPLHITNQSQTSAQSNCTNQLNVALNILKDKLPTGSQITIANTTDFGIVNSNQSIAAVKSWASTWYSDPLMPGLSSQSYFYNDLEIAYNRSMNVEGVVVRVETPTVTAVFPFLCGNGNLLENSKSYIEHGA